MLLLAGLLGMVAVGTVAMVDFTATEPEEETADINMSDGGQIISGTDAPDQLLGGSGDDQIGGYDGNDTISGGAGDDDIHGMVGDDTLIGDDGEDTLHGDGGSDSLIGGDDDDQLFGHNAADEMWGGDGNDAMQGSAGDDQLSGEGGDDAVQGGLDNDTLTGGRGSDSLFGGWGDDALFGVEDDPATAEFDDIDEQDFLNGGGGDDRITAGSRDIVTGGEGKDTIVVGDWIEDGSPASIVDFEADTDQLLVVFDEIGDEEPELILEQSDVEDDVMNVLMDGNLIAKISPGSAVDPEDVSLVSLATAKSMGLVS